MKTGALFTSSPRPWGCFYFTPGYIRGTYVFPTPVGVFLWVKNSNTICMSLPHARGGVSQTELIDNLRYASSPRPWGCF
ncbi:conserved hypothetical protein [methanotrophic bacterial endosymbiont of Bathymodiolus sp.]|nr:conserved hypothetical protein [methanotrophic bacterial endosymbiont of Bathymodiolus sp.]